MRSLQRRSSARPTIFRGEKPMLSGSCSCCETPSRACDSQKLAGFRFSTTSARLFESCHDSASSFSPRLGNSHGHLTQSLVTRCVDQIHVQKRVESQILSRLQTFLPRLQNPLQASLCVMPSIEYCLWGRE